MAGVLSTASEELKPTPSEDQMAATTAAQTAQASAASAAATTAPPVPSMDVSGVLGQAAGPQSYTPGENSLVSSQLSKLLSGDNPSIQRARTRAAQLANERGLLNSSMAVGASEAAAIDAALPIAQADAAANLGAQRYNTDASNQFAQRGNDLRFTAARDQYQGVLSQAQQAQQFGYTTARDTAQFDQRMKEIRATTEADLQRLDVQNKTNLAGNYRTATQTTYDGYLASVTAVQQSDMDPDVKQQQIASLQSLFQTRQTFLNTIYRSAPQWTSEWSQVALEFGGP